MKTNYIKSLIGDKNFYKHVLRIMIPIMIQNGITNFVNMLDNVMIGRIGVVEMTGVAIANQLIFIFNLSIFGAISGASIFGAQFFGKGDHKGHLYTFRFKIILSVLLTFLAILILYFAGDQLTMLYLTGEGSAADIAASLHHSKEYLLIMFLGLLPYALSQCYAGTLRETGQATLPMFSGILAVLVNLFLNYVLIFGHLGAPALGVRGAAIATVISRFAELLLIAIWTHLNVKKNHFVKGIYKSLYIPSALILQISKKGIPLLTNELMFALGVAMTNQCYSTLGYDVVSANNICQTFYNVFGVSFMAVGAAVAIILGQLLGANKLERARDASGKLIAFSIFVSIIVSAIFLCCVGIIPGLYNTTEAVRKIAIRLMQICAITMPFDAIAHATYFTLRSGGKIYMTMLMDSGFVCLVSLPLVFVLSRYTSLSVFVVYGICQMLNLVRSIIGWVLVNKGVWIRNMVYD